MGRFNKAVFWSALLSSSYAFSIFGDVFSLNNGAATLELTPQQVAAVKQMIKEEQEDDSSSKRPLGKFYAGATAGYGRMEAGDDSLLTSSLLEPLLSIISNTKTKEGGLAYRGYAGCLFEITEHVSMGAEGGFSTYPPTKGQVSFGSASISSLSTSGVGGSVRAFGYGTDMLVNITTYFIPELYFSFKPGIQLAHQTNKVLLNLGTLLSSSTGTEVYIDKFTNVDLLPEVILSTGWNFIINRFAFFLEFNYQHVFGTDDAPVTSRVSSRDMIGGSLGFSF